MIDFGDDPALFGERRDRREQSFNTTNAKVLDSCANRFVLNPRHEIRQHQ